MYFCSHTVYNLFVEKHRPRHLKWFFFVLNLGLFKNILIQEKKEVQSHIKSYHVKRKPTIGICALLSHFKSWHHKGSIGLAFTSYIHYLEKVNDSVIYQSLNDSKRNLEKKSDLVFI